LSLEGARERGREDGGGETHQGLARSSLRSLRGPRWGGESIPLRLTTEISFESLRKPVARALASHDMFQLSWRSMGEEIVERKCKRTKTLYFSSGSLSSSIRRQDLPFLGGKTSLFLGLRHLTECVS
jgi:hypothetical protein